MVLARVTKRVILALGLLTLAAQGASAPEVRTQTPHPACVAVSASAHYGAYGYDHVVTLKSSCARDAGCTVKTDVNPEPIAVRVAAGKTAQVVTFRGSPASTFRATVACRLDD